MGSAAYNRGSKVIASQIERDYLASPTQAHDTRMRLERMELQIEALNDFSLKAQALFTDSTFCDDGDGLGMLKAEIQHQYKKKKNHKVFIKKLKECDDAHIAWLDGDARYPEEFIPLCYRKARAWLAVLEHLNQFYRLPFDVPPHM